MAAAEAITSSKCAVIAARAGLRAANTAGPAGTRQAIGVISADRAATIVVVTDTDIGAVIAIGADTANSEVSATGADIGRTGGATGTTDATVTVTATVTVVSVTTAASSFVSTDLRRYSIP